MKRPSCPSGHVLSVCAASRRPWSSRPPPPRPSAPPRRRAPPSAAVWAKARAAPRCLRPRVARLDALPGWRFHLRQRQAPRPHRRLAHEQRGRHTGTPPPTARSTPSGCRARPSTPAGSSPRSADRLICASLRSTPPAWPRPGTPRPTKSLNSIAPSQRGQLGVLADWSLSSALPPTRHHRRPALTSLAPAGHR